MGLLLTIGSAGTDNNELYKPYGIVQDPSTKTLYIADYNNHRMMSYTSDASLGSIVAGGNGLGTNNTQLNYPTGLYFDSFMNSLVIANFKANNIVQWTLGASNWTLVAGSITGSPGNSSVLLYRPADVTLDPIGNVHVVDTGNHQIQLFLAGQTEGTTIAGISYMSGSNSTQLTIPYIVRLDSQLNLYVVDTGNSRIQRFLLY
ncbi:unnamed protein product [Rotaria sordida]|uniref:NHL repeat containing protein n=1 Tax=Rotaria sordida TaxID=392033 RepID=A0A819SER6_9BILA|nr:unnamed protein product [Rotaria sordida]CAF4058222.1 unnamed protein product [Rotaria sordida]